MWQSTQHLMADVIDMLQWNIYAIYKSQAGKSHVPKPTPLKRPVYGKVEPPVNKPKKLADLGGFIGTKIVEA